MCTDAPRVLAVICQASHMKGIMFAVALASITRHRSLCAPHVSATWLEHRPNVLAQRFNNG